MAERLAIIPHPVLWRGVAEPLAGAPQHFDVSAVPEDLLLVVVGFLDDYRDVLRFGRVCKACQLVASNDTVWRTLYESRFPRPSHAPQRGWRDLYRCVPCAKLRTRFRGAKPRPLSKKCSPTLRSFNAEAWKLLLSSTLQAQLDMAYPRYRVAA